MPVNEVQGVIARASGAPVELVPVLVPDPGPGEALVRVQACGVCHTDLHYREGAINNEFPFLLGHEAAGIVAKVGADVANVQPGDFVIIAWRAPCGNCPNPHQYACRHCRTGNCRNPGRTAQAATPVATTPFTATRT